LTIAEYVAMVRHPGSTADFRLSVDKSGPNKEVLAGLWDDIGQVPEYLDASKGQAGTFHFTPAGLTLPFRHEILNSLLALVTGRLGVKIVPSWDLPLMRNMWDFRSELDGRAMPADCPRALDRPQILECVVESSELLFLPVGCWYLVEHLEPCAMVAFTNFVFDNDFDAFYVKSKAF